ncbi:hypothetical protein [Deinococcus gobiensis]|uniref:DUF11 domain-containing protein n=1 Tax=Deinococcus gobiensis (strain DSM 21396 / JCM 16679 / CGMCC 1.7299 / I-0) TaxID=745776 RepID=H8GTN7_DEIGI|nr:hypothetical protein [Deinococcus gobiensis]AFD25365.1 hypothetical protein DGo_CA1438 [Deinococcus gobiensis I-0]
MKTTFARLTLLPLLLGAAQFASAQTPATSAQNSPVRVTASNQLVTQVTVDGKSTERLTEATNARPGNLLQLNQKVDNVSAGLVRGLALNMNVDPATTFQAAQCSVSGVTTLFSADGKTFAQAPLKKTVTVTENGQSVKKEVVVPPSEYKAVRWQLPDLAGGKSTNCYMRVTVR